MASHELVGRNASMTRSGAKPASSAPEERTIELARLRLGETGGLESHYRFLRDSRLVGRKRWRLVTPLESSTDVLLQPRRTG